MMWYLTFILTPIVCFNILFAKVQANANNFKGFLQASGKWSKDNWMQYMEDVPPLKEFTVCHWEKLNYFANSENIVWTYCQSSPPNDPFRCIGVYTVGVYSSANRQLRVANWMEGWMNETVTSSSIVNEYHHRTWNHFCWSYSGSKLFSKLYHNGQLIENATMRGPNILDSRTATDSAFIVGQDQDIIRGGYDAAESFYGEIAELNMWDEVVDDQNIESMSRCKNFEKGNAVAWKREYWKTSNVAVDELTEPKEMCRKESLFVVFPHPAGIHQANKICQIHGGSVVVPRSKEENDKFFEILEEHNSTCQNTELFGEISKGKFAWLGLEKHGKVWRDAATKEMLKPKKHFSNWMGNGVQSEHGCAFINTNNYWSASYVAAFCETLRLCFVCSISRQPVFTLKGLCKKASAFDWNFYLHVNNSNQIEYFDGYKGLSKIEYHDADNIWAGKAKGNGAEIKQTSKENTPLGRLVWHYREEICNIIDFEKRVLTLSYCDFGKQFTCDSGHCISLSKRCNNIEDCPADKSDEDDCDFVEIPKSYRKIKPPRMTVSNSSLEGTMGETDVLGIATTVKIINVNAVDTVKMWIGLTVDVQMTWYDNRLRYRNLVPGQKHMLSRNTAEKLWLPLEKIVYDNAVLGKVHKNKVGDVAILATQNLAQTIESMNPYRDKEDTWYKGEEQAIEMTLRQKIDFSCTFKLIKFPFDEQQCDFSMTMKNAKYLGVKLLENQSSVEYKKPLKINEFEIIEITSMVTNVERSKSNHGITSTGANEISGNSESKFVFTMYLRRHYEHYIVSLFFPTLLLWLIAYMTLFLNPSDISNRSRISITILLVLVSLIGSIKQDIPQTSYLKCVDGWFIWYNSNIFIITCFHVGMEYLFHRESCQKKAATQIVPLKSSPKVGSIISSGIMANLSMSEKRKPSKEEIINYLMAAVLLVATALFNVAYFAISFENMAI